MLVSANKGEAEVVNKFPLTPMGVLAHRLRMLDRSLVPPSICTEIFDPTFFFQPIIYFIGPDVLDQDDIREDGLGC